MNSIISNGCPIHFNKECYKQLNQHLKEVRYSKIFVLVDENTHEFCLPSLLSQIETTCDIEIIEIESGEEHKNIETCLGVWEALSELEADRKSLLINVGGGVITDLGGFVACTFKRGMAYINVPTSLLSMVDASIGGKTGVDLGHLKNQIGVISSGEMVLIDTSFLSTLPENQFRSGVAEMLKHGLIQDETYFNAFKKMELLESDQFDQLIHQSILIKKDVVEKDPNENNLRKTLNYGHTLGHAIESYYLSHPQKNPFLHGEAIVIGMILETYISFKQLGFPEHKLIEITKTLIEIFDHHPIAEADFQPIIELLKYDKKNDYGQINFVLLEDIGLPKIDCQVDNNLIEEAFIFYNNQ